MIRPINRTLLQTQILVKKAPPFYGNLSINYFLPTTPKAEGRLGFRIEGLYSKVVPIYVWARSGSAVYSS